jgi:hypothetical protein
VLVLEAPAMMAKLANVPRAGCLPSRRPEPGRSMRSLCLPRLQWPRVGGSATGGGVGPCQWRWPAHDGISTCGHLQLPRGGRVALHVRPAHRRATRRDCSGGFRHHHQSRPSRRPALLTSG